MKSWVRNSLIAFGSLVVLVGAAYYWLIVESHMPGDAQFTFDIGEVRRLANTAPGDKPTAIEVERIAAFQFPATAVVAGDGWQSSALPVLSYRLVYPQTSVIIDAALNKEMGGSDLASFDAEAYARMQTAMTQSSLILITHEHPDHIGGLVAHPNLAAVLPSARLTREQITHADFMLPAKFPDHVFDAYTPLDYEKYQVVAPGIVLIKAPGHTPGSQMVYVQMANASEFLFIGDVAWHFRNIETQRERPRLLTKFLLKEDRSAVFGELAALYRLHQTQPDLHIVPGHDGAVIDGLVASGALKAGFGATAVR